MHEAGAAIAVQAWWRCHHARTIYQNNRYHAIVIQKYLRRRQGRCTAIKAMAATRIQAVMNGYGIRDHFWLLNAAAVPVQSVVRGHLKRLHLSRCHAAAVRLQCYFRTESAQSKFRLVTNACIRLQAGIRGRAGRIRWSRHFSAVTMQSTLRQLTAHRWHCSKVAAQTAISALWRCHNQYCKYWTMLNGFIYFQALARSHISYRQYHKDRQDIITIQSLQRKRMATALVADRRQRKLEWDSATLIQVTRDI